MSLKTILYKGLLDPKVVKALENSGALGVPGHVRDEYPKGTEILSRGGGLTGVTTGGLRHCQLSGCDGWRVAVRWPDGKITYPCSRGLEFNNRRRKWQIQ